MDDTEKRAPIAKEPLSVALTLREETPGNLEVLQEWVTFLNSSALDYELLLAPEQAGIDVAALTAKFARARAIDFSSTPGYGAALRAALKQAKRPLLFYGRCSPRFKPADLKQFLREIDEVDVVFGVRGGRPFSWRDHVKRRLIRLLFGLTLEDPGCRFVLARRDIFRRIPIQSDGVFAHLEILAKAHFLECTGVPLRLSDRPEAAQPVEPIWADFRRVFAHPEFLPAAPI
ncbi:MAG: hypothetical protein AB7K24_32455 [Gemmataceae bacterium]